MTFLVYRSVSCSRDGVSLSSLILKLASICLRGRRPTTELPSTMASADRAALLALYRSTGGLNWRRSRNWNTEAELSQWYGVEVDDEGRVVKLKLDFLNLEGNIPG